MKTFKEYISEGEYNVYLKGGGYQWDEEDNIVGDLVKFPYAPHDSLQQAIFDFDGQIVKTSVPSEIAEHLYTLVEEPDSKEADVVREWIEQQRTDFRKRKW